MFRTLHHHLLALLASLAELVFLAGAVPGAVMLALIACRPGLALGGIAAWVGAWGFDRLVGAGGGRPLTGVQALNPWLSGLAVGHLVAIGWDLPLLAAGAGAATLVLTRVLMPFLGTLPVLSLPFSLVATALWLAVPRWNALPAALPGHGWMDQALSGIPTSVQGFCSSLGALIFLPMPVVGAVLALLITWHSRILIVLALAGWAVHVLLHGWLRGDVAAALAASDGFNAMLAAMAIGGVFVVPSWRSLVLALLAAAGCTAIGDALTGWWAGAGVPAFTIPFCVVVMATLKVLANVGSPLLIAAPTQIPEDALAGHWAWRARFPGSLRSLSPPFAGPWTVWQGTDGRWTHQGAWRHAIDFVIVGADGETHVGSGNRLEDYHAFNQAVLSPVSGQVVAVVDGVPDATPGQPDQDRRWGNLVVIHDPRGFWVEISHLACQSLAVAPGAWVERGQLLGRCGNSGYSPQPHIHLQVQASAVIGAATLPFSLASWWGDDRFHSNDLPGDGVTVEPLPADPALEATSRILLGQRLEFDCFRAGLPAGRLVLTVGLGDDGGTVLTSPRGRLHVGRHENTFYAYRCDGDDPWLRLWLAGLPRLPLVWRQGLVWSDALPVTSTGRGWREMGAALLGLFIPALAVARTRHRMLSRSRIDSEVIGTCFVQPRRIRVDLAGDGLIAELSCGDLRLQRIAQTVAEASHAAA